MGFNSAFKGLIGGCVGLSFGLDGFLEKIKIIGPVGNWNNDRPGRSYSLYRLHCLGSYKYM